MSELPRMMRADVQFQIYRLEQMAMGGALSFDAEELRNACHMIRTLATEIDRAPVQASEARGDWVLVPPTLTLEMYSAWCQSNGEGMSFHLVQAQWAAMLAAAPVSAHTQAGPVG